MKKQKNSRPAGTGTAENAKPEKILHKHYTTNPAKKQAIFASIFVGVALFIVLMQTNKTPELTPIQHKVKSGETLWSISMQYKPCEMTMDEYMSFVYKNNESALIFPGDTVIVGVAK